MKRPPMRCGRELVSLGILLCIQEELPAGGGVESCRGISKAGTSVSCGVPVVAYTTSVTCRRRSPETKGDMNMRYLMLVSAVLTIALWSPAAANAMQMDNPPGS